MKAVNLLTRILEVLTVLTFMALVTVVLIQITGRYTSLTFIWTEELSRFLFIYAVAFAAPVAMNKREYVRVDLLLGFLPARARKIYDAFIYLILGLFSAFLVKHAYDFAFLGRNQLSATLSIKLLYINLSMVVVFVLLALYSFLNIMTVLKEEEKVGEEE